MKQIVYLRIHMTKAGALEQPVERMTVRKHSC